MVKEKNTHIITHKKNNKKLSLLLRNVSNESIMLSN